MENRSILFHQRPNIDPETNEQIVINSKRYNQLVKKYGSPKIKSPKTNYKITVGKGEYNKLINDGYTEHQLLTHRKIKSPVSQRLITEGGKTYKNLIKEGYFVSLTGNKDVDELILLQLNIKDLSNIPINKWTYDILNDDYFWCQWIKIHLGFNVNEDCNIIAKKFDETKDFNYNYQVALLKGYYPVVKFLLTNNLASPVEVGYDKPLTIAVRNGYVNIVELLLSYKIIIEDYDTLVDALYSAIIEDHLDIVQLLLYYPNIKYNKDNLTELLSTAVRQGNKDIIITLIDAGASPNDVVLDAIYAKSLNILKLILSYPNVNINTDIIQYQLGLRQYKRLKLLMQDERTNLPQYIKDKSIEYIDNKKYNDLDELLKPYLTNLGVFYEVRDKWYGQMLENEELNDEDY